MVCCSVIGILEYLTMKEIERTISNLGLECLTDLCILDAYSMLFDPIQS
jgi:hypothetical protein